MAISGERHVRAQLGLWGHLAFPRAGCGRENGGGSPCKNAFCVVRRCLRSQNLCHPAARPHPRGSACSLAFLSLAFDTSDDLAIMGRRFGSMSDTTSHERLSERGWTRVRTSRPGHAGAFTSQRSPRCNAQRTRAEATGPVFVPGGSPTAQGVKTIHDAFQPRGGPFRSPGCEQRKVRKVGARRRLLEVMPCGRPDSLEQGAGLLGSDAGLLGDVSEIPLPLLPQRSDGKSSSTSAAGRRSTWRDRVPMDRRLHRMQTAAYA